jgi:transcription elongation factor Elf1
MQQSIAMSDADTLLRKSKSLCTDHDCPNCGTRDHVTAERVLIGEVTTTVCHCRTCGHSWNPQIKPDVI